MLVSLTSVTSPIKGYNMQTTELLDEQLKDPLDQVHKHTIATEDLRLIIENNPEDLLPNVVFGPGYGDALAKVMSSTISVKSDSGSTYKIDFIGPTQEKQYYAGTTKVRRAKYTRTQANGKQNVKFEYIGLSAGSMLRLMFFSNIEDESSNDDDEHSIFRIPSSDVLDPEAQLVIDWNKE
ncbi:MAG TPA: hypothetical protein VIM31_03200 [Candidatus Microsaccharimonas sp.]|jgi:hypothetical protein